MFRLRQILTFSVLLLFSLESLANISFDSNSGTYSPQHKITQAKDSIALFSFITEENENEERDDDKMHGLVIDLVPVLRAFVIHADNFKYNLSTHNVFIPGGHQQVLQLTGLLMI